MPRIIITDLPTIETLSHEEAAALFGAGRDPLRAILGLEGMETRDMLAANLTATFADGLLRIEGTDARDRIIVREDSGQISVESTQILVSETLPAASTVARASVTRIAIAGLEGDDFLALLGTDSATFPGGVQLSGGAGSDAIVAPNGVSLDNDPADKLIGVAEFTSDPLQQARFELLYKFRDEFGYVAHYDKQTGKVEGDGEGTLSTAIAAIAIATGNYHQDAWESAQANAVLEDLLGTLLHKSWGNRDGLGREHPIRHPNIIEYTEAGDDFRKSPMTKDSFGAIVAAAHYAYDCPHSSQAVRQLARDLITKWSEYLVLNQWRTHSTYIPGEFDTDTVQKTDPNTGETKSVDVYRHIYSKPAMRADGSQIPLEERRSMAKGPEGFMLLPHEIYALQNVAADMGIPTSGWNVWGSAMTVELTQTLADYAAPILGAAAGRGLNSILEGIQYSRAYDVKVNFGGREVSVLQGSFSISIPEGTRIHIVDEFSKFVTDAIREVVRLYNFQDQMGDLIGLGLNRVLDLLPDQLGKDSWRSILTGAVQQVLPWLSYDGLIEAGTFIATLQLNKKMNQTPVVSYTMWSYAAEFETRPEIATLVKPVVQEYFSFLRGNDNPNSLWAWLAGDSGRVNEHLQMFKDRILATDPENRLSSEFAYNSTKFNEFVSRHEAPNTLFPRIDYVLLQGLAEMTPPRGATTIVSDWWSKFVNAAGDAYNRFIASVKAEAQRAGEYIKERWDAAGGYIKERWDIAGNYAIERRDAAGQYVKERWDALSNYVLERGDALGKSYAETRDATGATLAKAWKDSGRWISQQFDGKGSILREWIYYDDVGTKLYQWRAWAGGKLTDFEQYTSAGWQEVNKFISTSGKWVSQTLDSAGNLLKEWIYYDAAGTKLYQWRAWAGGKLTDFEQYTSAGWQEVNKFISTSGKWVSQTLDSAGNLLKDWIYYDAAGTKLYQWRAWAGGKLTDFEQYTSAGWQEVNKFISTSGKWVSQTLDSAGNLLKEWIYYDAAGTKLYQWRAWAGGKLTDFEQYTSAGWQEVNKFISTSGKWVSQTLDSAGNLLKEWIYYDAAGTKLYQWRAWAGGKLTDFEQYTSAGWQEIDKWVDSSGRWISQKLDSARHVLQEWIYYDAAGTKLRQYGAWAGGKLTELSRYASDGVTRTFWSYVSTTGNWVERSYSNGVETAVKVWNSAGTYLGDQLKNYSDAAAKLDPTTKSWWPL